MDLSPLKRQLIAVVFLLILIPSEIFANSNFVRIRRVETCRMYKRTKNDPDVPTIKLTF